MLAAAALQHARKAADAHQAAASVRKQLGAGAPDELGFAAGLTLASALAACELWTESLPAYQLLLDNPAYAEVRFLSAPALLAFPPKHRPPAATLR